MYETHKVIVSVFLDYEEYTKMDKKNSDEQRMKTKHHYNSPLNQISKILKI